MEDRKEEKIYYLNVEDILPNRFQPRLVFDEKELNDLSDSIIKYGIIQPIVVRKIYDKYEIIAGERRYKAACLAGFKTVPAIINNTDDNTSAEMALLENLQRKNLTVIEEAMSFKKLLDKGFTQEELANKLSISQSSIANKIRLLTLPKEVKDALLYNKISERHARSLLTINDENLQIDLLKRIIEEKLTVKQTEDEINNLLMKNNEKEEYTKTKATEQIYLDEKDDEKDNEKLNLESISIPDVVNITDELDYNNSFDETISTEQDINPYQLNNFDNSVLNDYSDINNQFFENNTKIDNIAIPADIYKQLIEYIDKTSKQNNLVHYNSIELQDRYQILINVDKY